MHLLFLSDWSLWTEEMYDSTEISENQKNLETKYGIEYWIFGTGINLNLPAIINSLKEEIKWPISLENCIKGFHSGVWGCI